VILDGLAITVGERAVYGLDLATGDVAWEVARAGGPLSVPAVVSARGEDPAILLYLEGPDGDDGAAASPAPTGAPGEAEDEGASELVAVELGDRTELWRASLGATSRTGVAVDGDAVYLGDQDGTVYSFGLADGAERWTADAGGLVDGPIAVADGLVIAVGRSSEERTVAVSAFDQASGERRWNVPLQTGSAASAAAAGDGRVVVGFADRFVRGLGLDDGEDLWSELALNFFLPWTSPALPPGTVYVADVGGGLYRLDAEDGSRDWSHQLNEVVLRSSPVVSGDTVLLGLKDGRLVAVDADSGHLVWQSDATPGLVGAIALSHEVVVAVKGGREAGLIAFEHDPQGRLLDVPSPTELDSGSTLPRIGLALAVAFVVVVVPGIAARRRFGDALPAEDDTADPVEDDA
jgi:outer membrane protein assembly factor BamB